MFMRTVHLPALWLAAMATEESQHHQQSEGSSRPMETGVAVAMVKKAIHPLFLWKHDKTNSHKQNIMQCVM